MLSSVQYSSSAQVALYRNPATTRAGATGNAVSGKASEQALAEEQLNQLRTLQSRDREVRNHEAAHQAAAGGLSLGAASFSFQRGPDGNLYAIDGEVPIDTSPVAGDPEATLRKAETVIRAALAPAQPSSQDRQVAAEAAQTAAEARTELALKTSRQAADRFAVVEDSDRPRTPQIDLTI